MDLNPFFEYEKKGKKFGSDVNGNVIIFNIISNHVDPFQSQRSQQNQEFKSMPLLALSLSSLTSFGKFDLSGLTEREMCF
jgi:hypothetical protein